MTAAQLIARAERALRSGQPRLAMLYMGNASREVLADRFMWRLVSGLATHEATK